MAAKKTNPFRNPEVLQEAARLLAKAAYSVTNTEVKRRGSNETEVVEVIGRPLSIMEKAPYLAMFSEAMTAESPQWAQSLENPELSESQEVRELRQERDRLYKAFEEARDNWRKARDAYESVAVEAGAEERILQALWAAISKGDTPNRMLPYSTVLGEGWDSDIPSEARLKPRGRKKDEDEGVGE